MLLAEVETGRADEVSHVLDEDRCRVRARGNRAARRGPSGVEVARLAGRDLPSTARRPERMRLASFSVARSASIRRRAHSPSTHGSSPPAPPSCPTGRAHHVDGEHACSSEVRAVVSRRAVVAGEDSRAARPIRHGRLDARPTWDAARPAARAAPPVRVNIRNRGTSSLAPSVSRPGLPAVSSSTRFSNICSPDVTSTCQPPQSAHRIRFGSASVSARQVRQRARTGSVSTTSDAGLRDRSGNCKRVRVLEQLGFDAGQRADRDHDRDHAPRVVIARHALDLLDQCLADRELMHARASRRRAPRAARFLLADLLDRIPHVHEHVVARLHVFALQHE